MNTINVSINAIIKTKSFLLENVCNIYSAHNKLMSNDNNNNNNNNECSLAVQGKLKPLLHCTHSQGRIKTQAN